MLVIASSLPGKPHHRVSANTTKPLCLCGHTGSRPESRVSTAVPVQFLTKGKSTTPPAVPEPMKNVPLLGLELLLRLVGRATDRRLRYTMGAHHSCPCNGDSNVYFPPEENDEGDAIVVARKVPDSPRATTLNTGRATSLEKSRGALAGNAPITKGKSRKWAAQPKDGSGGVDLSATSTQVRHLLA